MNQDKIFVDADIVEDYEWYTKINSNDTAK